MLDTKEKPVEGKLTEPAKQWRNKWLVLKEFYGVHHERNMRPGDEYKGTNAYPSKDEAELAAAECFLDPQFAAYHGEVECLGAFPVTP